MNTTAVLAADRRNMGIKEEKGRRKEPGAFVVGDESVEETTALSPSPRWVWGWVMQREYSKNPSTPRMPMS